MLSKTAVKYIQSLSFKKFRDENNIFVAEGPKVVNEIITSATCKCKAIYALESYLTDNVDLLRTYNLNFIPVNEIELGKISGLKKPNQVVALFYKKDVVENPDLNDNLILVLDDISDPGNMGTIIRIADWFGLKQIICSENCVDIYNSKVVQSSMASIARLNIVYTDLLSFIESHKDVPVYAATLQGENLFNAEKSKNCFIIIGNESNGINPALLEIATRKISIPRIGAAESLNAAVATGIILSSFKN